MVSGDRDPISAKNKKLKALRPDLSQLPLAICARKIRKKCNIDRAILFRGSLRCFDPVNKFVFYYTLAGYQVKIAVLPLACKLWSVWSFRVLLNVLLLCQSPLVAPTPRLYRWRKKINKNGSACVDTRNFHLSQKQKTESFAARPVPTSTCDLRAENSKKV